MGDDEIVFGDNLSHLSTHISMAISYSFLDECTSEVTTNSLS